MKQNFNPRDGFKNMVRLLLQVGADNVHVNTLQVDIDTHDQAVVSDRSPQVQSPDQQFSIADIEEVDQALVQAVLVNNLRIGRACTPFEVIRVKTSSGVYPVTVVYDTGSQITLCNFKAGPLLVGSKLADKKITISTVNSARASIRKIYTLTLGDSIMLDAILIPNLQLHLKSIEIPEEFTHLDEEFADQETFAVGAQILIGADRSKLFPDWVRNADGTFVETENCRIMRSVITNRIIPVSYTHLTLPTICSV